jgi:hypothetical protein
MWGVLNRTGVIMVVCGFLLALILGRILSLQPETTWSLQYLCVAAIDVGYRLHGYQRVMRAGWQTSLKKSLLEDSYGGGMVAWVLPLWAVTLVLWLVF